MTRSRRISSPCLMIQTAQGVSTTRLPYPRPRDPMAHDTSLFVNSVHWTIQPHYSSTSSFSEELAAAATKDECLYIDTSGKPVIRWPKPANDTARPANSASDSPRSRKTASMAISINPAPSTRSFVMTPEAKHWSPIGMSKFQACSYKKVDNGDTAPFPLIVDEFEPLSYAAAIQFFVLFF
jgi:hypothetical protein